jgi:16S rRNA processing protein RimM
LLNNPQPSPDQNFPGDFVALGVIVRPHGLKGEVKIHLTCSGLERLQTCGTLRLVKNQMELKRVSIQRAFLHTDGDAIVRFREVKGVEEAESLRGMAVAILAGEKAPLAENTYYMDDLVGLKVQRMDGQGLGLVEEVLEMPANWICVVRDGPRETLVPFLKSVVQEVDLKARLMKVDWMEELDGDAAD